MNEFKNRLRILREHKKLTRKEMSKLIGISHDQLYNWETGRGEPDVQTLGKVAALLRVKTDWLLGKVSNPHDELVPYRTATTADYAAETIGETFPLPPQIRLPIIGVVRAGPGGIAFEDPQGYANADADDVNGANYFYLRVKGDSMAPEIQPGDIAMVREQPNIEYGELAVVVIDGEEGTIKRVFLKNGETFLQAANPAYNRTEKTNNIKIVGKVKKIVRQY